MKIAFEIAFNRITLSNNLTSVSLSRSFPCWITSTVLPRATRGSALGWPTGSNPAPQHAHYRATKGYCIRYGFHFTAI